MRRGTDQPVTLDGLQRDGKFLWIYCTGCGRDVDLDPAMLPLPENTPVPSIGARMRCSVCGRKGVHTAPELYPADRAKRAARAKVRGA